MRKYVKSITNISEKTNCTKSIKSLNSRDPTLNHKSYSHEASKLRLIDIVFGIKYISSKLYGCYVVDPLSFLDVKVKQYKPLCHKCEVNKKGDNII